MLYVKYDEKPEEIKRDRIIRDYNQKYSDQHTCIDCTEYKGEDNRCNKNHVPNPPRHYYFNLKPGIKPKWDKIIDCSNCTNYGIVSVYLHKGCTKKSTPETCGLLFSGIPEHICSDNEVMMDSDMVGPWWECGICGGCLH